MLQRSVAHETIGSRLLVSRVSISGVQRHSLSSLYHPIRDVQETAFSGDSKWTAEWRVSYFLSLSAAAVAATAAMAVAANKSILSARVTSGDLSLFREITL
jgi:hypothetical protein